MDLSNLKKNSTKLILHMEGKGYSKKYIHTVQLEIDRILLHGKDNFWDSYLDIYHDYESFPHSKRSLLRKATLIGMIANFDLKGLYPGGHQWHALWGRGVYTRLIPAFQELVDYYRNTAGLLERGECAAKRSVSAISNFLYALQEMGCRALADVSERHVLSFFRMMAKNPVKVPAIKTAYRGY